MLKDLWTVALRFRSNKKALVSDIAKAYFTLQTGPTEKHVRRFVWRWGRKGDRWTVFAYLVVAMGDRPAACILEIAIRKTLDEYAHVDLVAANRLKEEIFVDDIPMGGEDEEIERFRGEEDPATLQCTGTIPTMLKGGGFKLKAIRCSGDEDDKVLEKLGGSVLGCRWSCKKDTMYVDFNVNVSDK